MAEQKDDRPNVGSIGSEWFTYHLRAIPADASDLQVKETRRAFYAGASAMFAVINRASSDGRTEDEGATELDRIAAELIAFTEDLRAGRA